MLTETLICRALTVKTSNKVGDGELPNAKNVSLELTVGVFSPELGKGVVSIEIDARRRFADGGGTDGVMIFGVGSHFRVSATKISHLNGNTQIRQSQKTLIVTTVSRTKISLKVALKSVGKAKEFKIQI